MPLNPTCPQCSQLTTRTLCQNTANAGKYFFNCDPCNVFHSWDSETRNTHTDAGPKCNCGQYSVKEKTEKVETGNFGRCFWKCPRTDFARCHNFFRWCESEMDWKNSVEFAEAKRRLDEFKLTGFAENGEERAAKRLKYNNFQAKVEKSIKYVPSPAKLQDIQNSSTNAHTYSKNHLIPAIVDEATRQNQQNVLNRGQIIYKKGY